MLDINSPSGSCPAAYLTSCTVWADANADGVRGSTEPSAPVTSGTFVFATGTEVTSLGTLHVLTAEESAGTVRRAGTGCGYQQSRGNP